MTENEVPEVAVVGATVIASLVAVEPPPLTVTAPVAAVRVPLVAVSVWLPLVLRVTAKVFVPATRAAAAGITAAASLEVIEVEVT